jgi:hypothetical protein
MNMKQLGKCIVLLSIGLVLFLASCSNNMTSSNSGTYYYEGYRITMAQYNSFLASVNNSQSFNFSDVLAFRQQLQNYNGYFIASASKITGAELYDFCIQRGVSPTDYNVMKSALDARGNYIAFFHYAPDMYNYIIWMYVEKE